MPHRGTPGRRRPATAFVLALALVPAGLTATAGAASARGTLTVSTKTVERFVLKRATAVGRGQQPLFPGARITKTRPWADCLVVERSRRWLCTWDVAVHEESAPRPGEDRGRQSTLRFCGTPMTAEGTYDVVRVRRVARSRALRLTRPWRASCALTQQQVEIWNIGAQSDDQRWQPVRSEPIPVPAVSLPAPDTLAPELGAAPEGAPSGAPPGPLDPGTAVRAAARPAAHAARTTGGTGYLWRGGSWLGCSGWQPWAQNPAYSVFFCFWRPPSAATLPGAALGLFSQEVVTYWEGYYWSGNDNLGRPLGTLFGSGQL